MKNLLRSLSFQPAAPKPNVVEALENRRLLSASVLHHAVHAHVAHHAHKHAAAETTTAATAATASSSTAASSAISSTATTSTKTSSITASSGTDDYTDSNHGRILDTIEFSETPTAVQTGLTTLASTDGLAAPTATQTVYLSNTNGVESYALVFTSTGTVTRIAVDQTGAAITDPTQTTMTWQTLSGTGTGSNAAATAEITAIATALGLTAPVSTTAVDVSTTSAGVSTYTVNLASSSSTSEKETQVSVDSTGKPVGDQTLPFSVLPTAIQSGINRNLPTGATALDITSTQDVTVLTANGVTFYSTAFTVGTTTSSVTVDSTGTVTTLPGATTTTFSAIPTVTQTELQTLATAAGITTAIASTQTVTAYNEGNGTTIYSVTLSGTNSSSQTFTITISSDELGNPTVPPGNGHGCGGGDDGNYGDFGAVDFGLASFGGGQFGS